MFDTFTKPAKRAMDAARESAGMARREICGIEHLVLGLATVTDSPAAVLLEGAGLTEASLRNRLGIPVEGVARAVSFSPAALAVIEEAKQVSIRMEHEVVDSLHVLIGIVVVAPASDLETLGIGVEVLRTSIAEVFGVDSPGRPPHPDLTDWIVERAQAEAAQLHAEIDASLLRDLVRGGGRPSEGAPDSDVRRLVRRAIALRHGGEVLRLEREIDRAGDGTRWNLLRRQAELLPPGLVVIGPDDLGKARGDLGRPAGTL